MKQTDAALVHAPTDLSNFLSCRHLSLLNLHAARGELKRPVVRQDEALEGLRKRGLAHERAYLARLRAQGLSIAGDAEGRNGRATLLAMRKGFDVIYQATLEHGVWSGRVDFLCKVDTPSDLGSWSYEPFDAKLARETKAGTILQLCVYASLLEKIQGRRPVSMHVVTPGPEPLRYQVNDYSAYFRLLERNIVAFTTRPDETYPELVPHCDACAWWTKCEARRRGDDHLCYVAGISRTQIKTLREQGVEKLAELAALEVVPKPSHGSREALERVREQARVQQIGRNAKRPYYELKIPFDDEHGLALLPEPAAADIFLDFEGDRFAMEGVQEYLLGYVTADPGGTVAYYPLWAETPEKERAAFEQFIDLAVTTRRRNPGAHVYHFAPYEPAALKRLMGRYATREVELDELLRGRAFVDLYAVVRRAVVASVEHYSIKDIEPFFGYARAQDLREAVVSRRIVENAIADGNLLDEDERLEPHRRIVEDYNREDCESALRLRDWLEQLRAEAVAAGHDIPRPAAESGEASEAISDLDRELQRLRDGLLNELPANPGERSPDQQAQFVLAHMMEFHRREDKAGWWEYFRLLELEEAEFSGERRALTGLVFKEVVDENRAPLHRYAFPSQELDARPQDDIYDRERNRIGQVEAVNYAARTIDIKKKVETAEAHPTAVVLHNRVPSDILRQALRRLGEAVLAKGLSPGAPFRAAMALLFRQPPPSEGAGPRLHQPGETLVEAACRIAPSLDGNVLAIQGPPGTGKTYTGAHIIRTLVRAGLKVGVTAVSHKVIVNLLETAAEQGSKDGPPMNLVHRQKGEYEGEWGIEREEDYQALRSGLKNGSIDVLGATAWCWARPEFKESVDVLIVDEAGQMALSNVLATAHAGRSLVLLGDPQQLEQPLQSSHPEGSEVSALSHLLAGADTMPAESGLFLDETYRLHPDLAQFTSEVYYGDRVKARPGLKRQAIVARGAASSPFTGSGLIYVDVPHAGNQARSPEEVGVVEKIVKDLISRCGWRDKEGTIKPLTTQDILVVAPYNAQVSALIEAMPALAERIGTIDRFQGQEAPVVMYSMTSSSPDDAPRGMEFLYNRPRFNVATSRARALCILVGSPELFRPECRTPHQMKMANGFCRYRELARRVESP